MKAITIHEDNSLVWEEVEYPVIRPQDVLIRIHCAGVNRADLLQRAGLYPPPADCPPWMGLEVSGEIAAIGPEAAQLSKWHINDRVCALLGGGGYAQYVAVPWTMVMPIPEGVSMEMAAALPEAYATSYLNLVIEANAKAGETLYMPAGTSGLASVAIPMAKSLCLYVITTVRTAAKAQLIAGLGADRVIATDTENLTDALAQEAAAGHPIDIAFDCLGGNALTEALPYVNNDGRWIIIATLAGDTVPVNLRTLYRKHIRLIGTTLRSRSPEEKGRILTALVKDMWPRVTDGTLRPNVTHVLPVTEADAAQKLLSAGKSNGKVVLSVL